VSKIPAAGLTISAVAARTGLGVSVLRSWEQRHGFPEPERLLSGHRRYPESEVARIQRVVAERRAGRTLEAAIEAVRRAPTAAEVGFPSLGDHDRSIFAGLRRARPDLHALPLGRRTMLALSQAIEDEARAHADRPHFVAAFQTRDAYEAAHDRWGDLAATAATTIVLADFPRSTRRGPVAQVAIPAGDPLRREWSVVCDAPGSSTVLAGWERSDGRFEAIWTVEAHAVRLATHIGRRLAARHAPRLDLGAPPTVAVDDDPATAVVRATAVTTRVVAYLDR
jgi:MerR family transcriptional regulator, light-induced transcriptional regulator